MIGLSEGLEVSIVKFSELRKENPRMRLDAQFQGRSTLAAISNVCASPHLRISDLTGRPLKGSNVPYLDGGDFAVVRSGDISNNFQPHLLLRSSARDDAFFLQKNDILVSSIGQGSIGKVQLFRHDGEFATVAEVTVVRVAKFEPAYVAAFLASSYGQAQIERYVTGATGQLHLYPSDVERIFIPDRSARFQRKIKQIYDREWGCYIITQQAQLRAQSELFNGLGLAGWAPSKPLSYVSRAADVLKAERFDAQYFRPLFAEVERLLVETGRARVLDSILSLNVRGRQPDYSDAGLPVVNSKHVRINRVMLTDNRTAIDTGSSVVIKKGDVLVNGTGDGTVGRAAPYLYDQRALPDNHVTVLRSDKVDPVYLSVFLNSPLGQWQIERQIKGSSGQIEIYPADISKIVFWDAPVEIQRSVRDAVMQAFDEERRASDLLDMARRAVEIAIEEGEPAALVYLDSAEKAI